jgi:transmembrane sensor
MDPQDQVDHKAIKDQASLWLARLDSGSADVEAFERWRDADPAHAAAFARTARLWSKLGDIQAIEAPAAEAPSPPSRRALLRAASLVGGATVLAAGGFASRTFAKSTATTRPGERRRVALGKGVAIDLNTDSQVSWRWDKGSPRVWLNRGEAAITVPASSSGPCVLKAGDITLDLAAGEFNARLRGDSLKLLVLRGTGALRTAEDGGHPSARFERGQSVVATASNAFVQRASAESFDEVSAWRRGEIVFQGAPLGAVVEDYNRYLTKKLVIADPELSKLRLGGRFTNSDPSDFLDTLHSGFGVRAVDAGDNTIILTRAE